MKEKATAAVKRPRRNDLQRQTILDAASLLFIEKGFGGTNINDIADAVGVGRTALYYYFPSKEAILEALTRDITGRAGELAKSIALRGELTPEEGLGQLIRQHAALILSHPLQFRVVERSESSLPDQLRLEAQSARKAVRDGFVDAIQRGIDRGVFQRCDAKIAAFAIIGMCNWSAWWFDSRRGEAVEPIIELLTSFGLRMLCKEQLKTSKRNLSARTGGDEVDQAITQLRDALETLERSFAAPR